MFWGHVSTLNIYMRNRILLIHFWFCHMENHTSKVFLKRQPYALSHLGTWASNDGILNPWNQIPTNPCRGESRHVAVFAFC